ncbi:MAG: polyprenyl synthetase family protein [Anaerolineae bacterium]
MRNIPSLELIQDELQLVEETMRQAVQADYPPVAQVLNYLLDIGGKRLRPALVLLATKFHKADFSKTLSLAAAVEMLHTATLVHDDIVDNSLVRRGNPTLNAIWSTGAVVLMGDYLFARAASLAAAIENTRILTVFAHTLRTICAGELRQIFAEGDGHRTKEDYYQHIYSKTASLLAAAAEAGGILSGAPEEEIAALREYGHYLGMAFQIVDDVLDFIGDEEELGKPVGSDLRQGTITLPVIYFFEDSPQRGDLKGLLADGSDEAVLQVVALVKDSPAIEMAMNESWNFAARAKEALLLLPENRYRQAMADLADFVVDRRM